MISDSVRSVCERKAINNYPIMQQPPYRYGKKKNLANMSLRGPSQLSNPLLASTVMSNDGNREIYVSRGSLGSFSGPGVSSTQIFSGPTSAAGHTFSGGTSIHQMLYESQAEISRLTQRIQTLDSSSSTSFDLRDSEQARNEQYRRIWTEEESRIKKLSDESRHRIDDVRNRMLNGLERIDAANQEMLSVMHDMMIMDDELRSLGSKL